MFSASPRRAVDSSRVSAAEREQLAAALREYIERHGSWATPFEGRSMEPSILNGCLLEISALPARLELGDLLVFVHDVRVGVCCHRVIALHADGRAVTQGDNVPHPDEIVPPSRFVGVVRRYRLGGIWYASKRFPGRASRVRRLHHRLWRAGERIAAIRSGQRT